MLIPRRFSDIMDELDARVRRYYEALNECSFIGVHAFLDVDLFDGFGDTRSWVNSQLPLHTNLLETFQRLVGEIEVVDIVMDIHLDENLPLYKGRDYAVGRTKWKSANGKIYFFSEHWVKGDRCWFTRNITPKS